MEQKTSSVRFGGTIDAKDRDDLTCPNCGSAFLHQRTTLVFERDEDDEMVMRTLVVGDSVQHERMPNDGSGNPSARRNGLVVVFQCENCSAEPELFIEQHKGNTFIGWRYLDDVQTANIKRVASETASRVGQIMQIMDEQDKRKYPR